jgi:hypothetical protein
MEVFSSHKTLGTFKCISGKEIDHFDYLLENGNTMAVLVEKKPFQQKTGMVRV